MHQEVAEFYYVMQGAGTVTVSGGRGAAAETAPIRMGDAIPLQLKVAKSFANTGTTPLELLVVGVASDPQKKDRARHRDARDRRDPIRIWRRCFVRDDRHGHAAVFDAESSEIERSDSLSADDEATRGLHAIRATVKLDNGRSLEGWFSIRAPRPAAARRRSQDPPAPRGTGSRVSRRDVTDRLAELQRRQNGSRYSPLTQIDRAMPAGWRRSGCTASTRARLQVTPVVADGVMYVTSANEMLRARRR